MADRRALVISYHTPQPDRDSGSRRVFQLIELLQEERWDVAVLAADGAGALHDVRTLTQRGIAVYDGYATSLEDLFRDGSYDLALVAYWPNAERYVPHIRSISPSTRIIVDSVDLHFVRESREVLRTADELRPRGLTDAHGSRFAAELNSYASADGVLTVSQKEADLVNDLAWDRALAQAVPDFEEIAPRFEPFSRRRGIVCIGSFEHPPNVEAVGFLCREVLPLMDAALLAKHPVWIVGNKLGESVRGFVREARERADRRLGPFRRALPVAGAPFRSPLATRCGDEAKAGSSPHHGDSHGFHHDWRRRSWLAARGARLDRRRSRQIRRRHDGAAEQTPTYGHGWPGPGANTCRPRTGRSWRSAA